ncbi:MAG: N-acetylneuraminate synthase family protein [Gammaproteobacteria bacterium]
MTHCFVIAEIGVNHNGSMDLAMELIERSAQAGADCVKFQTFKADELVCKGTAAAAYQTRTTGIADQHQLLLDLELSLESHKVLQKACEQHGVEFLSTGFSVGALESLVELGIARIKIPSGEITNPEILAFAGASGLPVILSTGMADLAEIDAALERIRTASSGDPEVTVLHCTSAYPAPLDQLNLRALGAIAEHCNVPVGYSDHSASVGTGGLAVALGAVCVEKHVTMDCSLPGPDHEASLEPAAFARYVTLIREAEQSVGQAIKAPVEAEIEVRDLVRRSVAARRDLAVGESIARGDLMLRRPGTGIHPFEMDSLVGRTVRRPVAAGTMLSVEDVDQ